MRVLNSPAVTHTIKSLEVGDEVTMKMELRNTAQRAITRLHKLGDKNFTTKKVSDKLFILRREK